MRSVLALTAALLGAAPAAASADGLPAPALREARQALSSYDVNGGTVEVIGELSSFLSEAQGADAREARFLRAVAAADLVLIARGQRRDDVPARVAEALGVERDRLVSFLRTELGHLDLGVYAPVARECRWALDALERREEDPAFLRDGRGERRDVLFVNAVVDALGAPEEIRRLAAFGADPCAEDAECPTAAFSATGRRAIEALREAHAALGRLEHIQSTGEPLAASLAAITTVDGAVLRTSAIRPTPQLPDRLRVHGVGARGREAQPDLIFVVDADALHYAFVPTVRIVGERVQLESAARPALPAWGEIPLGDDGRAVVLPFDDLVERLRPVAGRVPGAEVGLAATAEVASLRISRVLLSMVRAGMEPPALLSRGLHDEARSLPVELVMGEEREPPLELFVRMGGYSLSRRGAGSEDIPRVRDDRGLHFDLATLERRARAAGDVPAALRYMGVVEWGTVLDAAFHLRPESGPLSLVLY